VVRGQLVDQRQDVVASSGTLTPAVIEKSPGV